MRWGSIPAVHPSAANTLALLPWISPVETVYITPVPGISTTINDVMKNSTLIILYISFFLSCPNFNAQGGGAILNLEFPHHPAFAPNWNVLRKCRYKKSCGNGKCFFCHTYLRS
jgi:hypothetical protein